MASGILILPGNAIQLLGQCAGEFRLCLPVGIVQPESVSSLAATFAGSGRSDGTYQLSDSDHHLYDDFLWPWTGLVWLFEPRATVIDRGFDLGITAGIVADLAQVIPVRAIRMALAIPQLLADPTD